MMPSESVGAANGARTLPTVGTATTAAAITVPLRPTAPTVRQPS
jgi:hypothetical protein